MIILIPAYEPDAKLIDLLETIRRAEPSQPIVVVDDGSGPAYGLIFDQARSLGCTVLRQDHNRGKGAALKTGFAHIESVWPGHDVVCADCDGQHRLADITRVADALGAGTAPIVLGARSFTGTVPLRSRFGNSATRFAFAIATGHKISDTQTGLRAYRAGLLDLLTSIDGDRFEYELNILLAASSERLDIVEVPIETIYLDDNASSHFRPLVDSARIYAPLVKFAMSSVSAFLVDFVVFLTLMTSGAGLGFSVVGARVVSATFNYQTNRRFVFAGAASPARSAIKYFALVGLLLTANYTILRLLIDGLSLNIAFAKVLTESTLFAFSYIAQRRFVFTAAEHTAAAATDEDPAQMATCMLTSSVRSGGRP